MPSKKPKQAEEPDANQELVKRIDAMMSTELPSDTSSEAKAAVVEPEGQKTAPKLPAKLLKDTESDKPAKSRKSKKSAEPPIVIKLADEGKSLSEPDLKPEDTTNPATKEDDSNAVDDKKMPPEQTSAVEPEEPAENAADDEPNGEDENPPSDPLEDSATDKAVDDIVAHEGDTILAVNDALVARKQADAQPGRPSGKQGKHKWLWFVGLVVLIGTAIDLFLLLSG
jgi:hypothetical protein